MKAAARRASVRVGAALRQTTNNIKAEADKAMDDLKDFIHDDDDKKKKVVRATSRRKSSSRRRRVRRGSRRQSRGKNVTGRFGSAAKRAARSVSEVLSRGKVTLRA